MEACLKNLEMNSNIQILKEYFDRTHLYLNKPFGIQIRASLVKELIGEVQNVSVLDVGCGDGKVSLQFASRNQVMLLDISDQMLNLARFNTPEKYKANVAFLNTDFMSYKPDMGFDVVICLGVLAYVDSLDSAIQKLSSLTKPGGYCIIQFTDHNRPIAKINHCYFTFYRNFTKSRKYSINLINACIISDLCRKSNLEKVKEYRYSIILPGMSKIFSNSFLYRLEMMTLRNRFLSNLGPEILLLAKKI